MHSWTNASPISAGVDQHKRSSALLLEKAKLRLVLAQDLLHHSCGQTPGGGVRRILGRKKSFIEASLARTASRKF